MAVYQTGSDGSAKKIMGLPTGKFCLLIKTTWFPASKPYVTEKG